MQPADDDDGSERRRASDEALDSARQAATRASSAAEHYERVAGTSHRLRDDGRAARERLERLRQDRAAKADPLPGVPPPDPT